MHLRDPFGDRISKTFGGTTTKLLYDGPNVVQELVGESVTGNLITGLKPDQRFSRTTSGGSDSYLTNSLQSTIALANSSGEVKTSYTYDPFGDATEAGEASDNRYQFTGRENDETGLQFNRARYYSPVAGRFISQDPAGFEGSGTNLYWYATGDPLDLSDPSGEAPYEDGQPGIGDWPSNGPSVTSLPSFLEVASGEEEAPPEPSAVPSPLDPGQPPGLGWEWRGNGPPGSHEGAWHNPSTGESLHPDLENPEHEPHYDYQPRRKGPSYRVYPDGRVEPK